ncbi:MAG TPA: class I SAM-dependent methyltransferase [Bryobacteraceae bacterium]
MQRDWDRRARENHRHYIVNSQVDWSDEEFWLSGEQTVSHYVLTDLTNICQGRNPSEMRVLDFGCGAGRVSRALAAVFGEVHGVDISGEMVKIARKSLAAVPNIQIHHSNGRDLDVLADRLFDFAFAFSVFHHVPGKAAITHCIAEVGKHLHPGDLFKFEVQGGLNFEPPEDDTWLGTPLREADVIAIAEQTGFESRYRVGAGEESYWQWFFRADSPPVQTRRP